MKKAVVIVPTYNERENVKVLIPMLLEVFKKIKNWQMAVLIVDDTSPDKTYELVQEMGKQYPQVHLLQNKQKSGLGGAYLKGMAHAFNLLHADVVFEFDADRSHDQTKIPLFLEKLDAGYDMVLGSRYIQGGGIPNDWGWHRKFLSVVGNLIIAVVLTNFSIHDWTGGYRAITKSVYESVLPFLNSERFMGYTFQIGFLYNAVKKGYKIAEVPFVFKDRTHGHSKLGPEYIKNTLIYIMKVRIQEIINHRIFKFATVGGIGAVVQLTTLNLWRVFLPYQVSYFLSAECAVLSNFILNNVWTFSDKKLTLAQIPWKFLQFNLASIGSIGIQQVVALVGEFVIGLFTLFTLPIIGLKVDTGSAYAIFGILLGMMWNFFAYNKFIWNNKAHK